MEDRGGFARDLQRFVCWRLAGNCGRFLREFLLETFAESFAGQFCGRVFQRFCLRQIFAGDVWETCVSFCLRLLREVFATVSVEDLREDLRVFCWRRVGDLREILLETFAGGFCRFLLKTCRKFLREFLLHTFAGGFFPRYLRRFLLETCVKLFREFLLKTFAGGFCVGFLLETCGKLLVRGLTGVFAGEFCGGSFRALVGDLWETLGGVFPGDLREVFAGVFVAHFFGRVFARD